MAAALRAAAIDFYYNSWRLAPANLAWGATLIGILLVSAVWLPGLGLLSLLAVPVAGIARMAALIVRGESVALSEFVDGMRRYLRPALATGVATLLAAGVFTTNVVVGLEIGGVIGWTLSALALYGDIGLGILLVAWWPILVDPRREASPVRQRLRLAGLVVLSRPGRLLALTAVVAGILVASTFLLAAIVIFAVAYVSLVGARYVLPVADELEGRLAERRAG